MLSRTPLLLLSALALGTASSASAQQSPAAAAPNTAVSGDDLAAKNPVAQATAQQATAAADAAQQDGVQTLGTVEVKASQSLELPPAYEGNHLATGGSVGLLGNLDIMQTPFSTLNYTSDYIEDNQGQELRILIDRNDPSVQTPGAGATAGKDTIYIRGFAAGDVYLNGLQGLTSGRRTMAMAERLEVLKGPSALLYGMNASGDVGGSINMVTKRATVQPISNVSATYMAPKQFGTHVDVGRRFGPDNALGLRLNALFRDGEGMTKHRINRDKFISLNGDYDGGPLRLKTDFFHLEETLAGVNRGVGLAPELQRNPLPRPPKGDVLLSPPWAAADMHESGAMARLEYDFSESLSAFASLGHSRNRMHNYNTKGSTIFNEDGDMNLRVTRRHNQGVNSAANAGLFYDFSTGAVRHQLNVGADWTRQSTRIANTGLPGWSETINIYDPVYPSRPDFEQDPLRPATVSKLGSVGVADTLSFLDDKFRLTLGLRHQQVQTENRNTGTRYKESAWTPAVAGTWRFNDNWMTYGNYIQGLTEGIQVGDGYANEGEVFPPQRSKQYEIGMKYDTGDYAISAALFQISQPNTFEQLATAPDALPTLSYGGEQRNRGAEVQVIGQVSRQWRLTGGLAYLEPRYHRTDHNASRGKEVANLSRWVGKFGAEWDTPFLQGLTLTAHLKSQSRQYLDSANTYYVPGTTLYDLGARYETSLRGTPLIVRAQVENLTNKAYWTAPLRQGQGAPRTFLMSATLKF